jgi:biofilm PGA synthesis N-glycosyltransferase PgaC
MIGSCEVIVLAHNEVASVERTVCSVLNQAWSTPEQLQRVIVVSTASTDGTDEVVSQLAHDCPRVQLLTLSRLRGKAFDVNEGVAVSTADLLVISDADIVLSDSCIPRLLEPLKDGAVIGMTVPVRAVTNPRKGVLNRIGHLAAELQNATRQPKAGQIIAVRREYALVDERVAVDDSYQEWAVLRAGLCIRRVADATVYAVAPTTARDYIKQRRRVFAQYLGLERLTGYRPVTRSWCSLLGSLHRTKTVACDHRLDVVVVAGVIELTARILGAIDHFILRRSYSTWQAALSTKNNG